MRINSTINNPVSTVIEQENLPVRGDFSTNFSTAVKTQTKAKLDEIIEKIDSQAFRLAKCPTYKELKAYQSLIKDFLTETVGSMYKLETSMSFNRQGRQKVYTIVKQVKQTLADITDQIKSQEQSNLKILEKTDFVRGLLVDLYT